jgi:hypothetical protein
MNISKKILTITILAALSSTAFAAEKSNEVSVYGSLINQSTPASSTSTIVNATYGRYLTERLLLTGSVTVFNAQSFKMGTVGVGVKYYFGSGQKGDFVPFVAGSVNVGTIDTGAASGTTAGIRAGGGASYFVSETASFDARLELVAGSQSIGGFSQSTSSTEFTVGLTQRF